MLTPSLTGIGLLAQIAAAPGGGPGVRVWVSDTIYQVGAGARVFVQLREAGYLMVLHADATGHLRVLFPLAPGQQTSVPAGETFEITSDRDHAFRIEARGSGMLLALRARHPLRFESMRRGLAWDYEAALLLQPTAGNPFAALLDIADRVADGQPYDDDVVTYGTPGVVAGRAGLDTLCRGCFATRPTGRTPSRTGNGDDGAIAIDHSQAVAGGSTLVDCSGANLVDSFCGAQDNRVTNVYTDNSTYASNTVVYQPDVALFASFRHFDRQTDPAPPPPPPAITLPTQLRPLTVRLVPPPRRRRPQIVVIQPTAPSHPAREAAEPSSIAPTPAAASAGPIPRASPAFTATTRVVRREAASTWTGSTWQAGVSPAAAAASSTPAAAIARPLSGPRTLVPSRAMMRSVSGGHR